MTSLLVILINFFFFFSVLFDISFDLGLILFRHLQYYKFLQIKQTFLQCHNLFVFLNEITCVLADCSI